MKIESVPQAVQVLCTRCGRDHYVFVTCEQSRAQGR